MKPYRHKKQGWQQHDADRRTRLSRPLTWFAVLSLSGAAIALIFYDQISLLLQIVLWTSAIFLCLLFIQILISSRRRFRWRQGDMVFEPPLAKPITALYKERGWRLPSHPIVRYLLTLSLIVLMYWVLILNQMKLPGYWLIMLLLHALVCLWSWRHPLLLVVIVTLGVSLLTVIGWLASLSATGISGAMHF